MVAGGLVIIYGFPRLTTAIPSPLVCIVVLTGLAMALGLDGLSTIGDKGELPTALQVFLIPSIPLSLETLLIILPYSIPLAVVGLLEPRRMSWRPET